MKFLSVCSGIEAASVAWTPLGWQAVAFSEIEPFPCAVLAHHYPGVPNWGDMTKYKEWPDVSIDLLCGGTPCQSFSVAGLRKGLDDPRGNLMLTFGAIAGRYRPRWLVWENVPGVLSSGEGRDFGSFLGMLGQLGYGFAYRVLDAQYFGVAQRRRRVFVVGYLGDWRRAAAVLFERHSLSGNPAPSRETGKDIAPTLDVRAGRSGETTFHTSGGLIPGVAMCHTRGGQQRMDAESETLIPITGAAFDVANTLLGKPNSSHTADQETYIAHSLRGEGFDASEDGTGRGTPLVPAIAFDCKSSGQNGFGIEIEVAGTQRAMAHSGSHSNGGGHQAVVVGTDMYNGTITGGVAATLGTQSGDGISSGPSVMQAMQVRRLTPEECEALQAFPCDYTRIPWRGKSAGQCPDGPRYKALGNSWCVNVARWVGQRIEQVESLEVA